MRQQVPTGLRQSRFEYQMKVVLSSRHLALNRLKTEDFGYVKPVFSRLRFFFKVGFGRVIRAPDAIIRTGFRLFVICGESIDRRGIGLCLVHGNTWQPTTPARRTPWFPSRPLICIPPGRFRGGKSSSPGKKIFG